MARYYDPETGSEPLEGRDDIKGATKESDMPKAAQEWFTRPVAEGKQWQTDPTGKFPVEVDKTPTPLTAAERKKQERAWAQTELKATDAAMLTDSPYTDEEKKKIQAYRKALRNPDREAATGYPTTPWRPRWPATIKRPGE